MKAPHQVIYTHGGGRLGNQILRFVHWMAWAREHAPEVEVVNVAFWPFAEHFAAWRENPGCVFPPRAGRAGALARRCARLPERWRRSLAANERLARAIQATGRWWPGWQTIDLDVPRDESLDLDDPAFWARIKARRVTTCAGWRIAGWRRVAAQQEELRAFFRPAPEVERRAGDFIADIRRGSDLVVGVFIRQSDYREWDDGRFYFETSDYAGWMRQVLDLFPGRRVAFVIASESRQDPALLAGLPCRFATGAANAGGHWFESWAELSRCDLIVTPPSTFSATAAFAGGVPLWPVCARGQTMRTDETIADGLAGAARHPAFSRSVK